MKDYEAMFIFSPSLNEEALEKILERIRGEITKQKGAVKDSRIIGKRVFARPLKKKESGQYVKMDLSMEPQSINPLLARFKLNDDIFRVQILCAGEQESNVNSGNREENGNGKS